jgi:hypothetical protein
MIVCYKLGRILLGRYMTYFDVLVQNSLQGDELNQEELQLEHLTSSRS